MDKPQWPATLFTRNLRPQLDKFIDRVEADARAKQTRPLERHAPVSLREITKATARAILFLDVNAEQAGLVAPNAVSIAQAHFAPEAWFRAIYADETPVGFAMLEDWSQVTASEREEHLHHGKPYVYLWRFMIDARYQGMGFGEQALTQLINYAASRPGAATMLLSFVPNTHNPEAFYLRHGFARTGEMDGNEVVMARALP